MEVVKIGDGEFEAANEFDDVAAKTFFEFVHAVGGIGFVEIAGDTVKIIARVAVVEGVVDDLPLDEILSVEEKVFFGVTGDEVEDFFRRSQDEHATRKLDFEIRFWIG